MKALGSKTAIKILSIILENPLREFKEIELISSAKTGKGSGAAEINALVKENILLEKRQGRTKLLSLNMKSNTAFALKHLFSQNKIKNISFSKRSAIFFFKKEVKHHAHLMILFGSTLAGNAKEDSDIDIFIVPKEMKKIEMIRNNVEELLGEQFNLHYCKREQVIGKAKEDS
ncbi:MAG: nucleotidyltransferase domain-containing protein, partial [Nanoarchaeota archaeon]